ncbi:MAG TPA: DUF5056 domain-containing protein [Opitutus sp.]|nr:DUF5056 domain-containing protein [Opitutus sp.]
MEPTDLNPLSRDDERLSAILREAQPAIADDGFSTRVLAALPPPKNSAHPLLSRPFACAIGTLVGIAVAWNHGVFSASFTSAFADLRSSVSTSLATNADMPASPGLALALALAVTGASLFYAFGFTSARVRRP